MPQHHGRCVARVAHAPYERVVARDGGLCQRAPRLPVAVLAQLVHEDEVGALAAPRLAGGGLDAVLAVARQLDALGAVGHPHVLDLGGELRVALRHLDGGGPRVLGLLQVLCCSQHERHAEDVEREERQHHADERLAVLSAYLHHDRAVPEPPRGVEAALDLQRVDEEPFLPRVEGEAEDVLGELDHVVADGRVGRQLAERRREDARRLRALTRRHGTSPSCRPCPRPSGAPCACGLSPRCWGRAPARGCS